jgi:hypothetical protein
VRQFYERAPYTGYPPRDILASLRARAERSEFARLLNQAIPGDARRNPPAVKSWMTAHKFLTDSFNKCAKELDAMLPEQLDKEVYKFRGQPVLAREALWYTFTHMAHHRGQAEVYLRVKNIKPPVWRF